MSGYQRIGFNPSQSDLPARWLIHWGAVRDRWPQLEGDGRGWAHSWGVAQSTVRPRHTGGCCYPRGRTPPGRGPPPWSPSWRSACPWPAGSSRVAEVEAGDRTSLYRWGSPPPTAPPCTASPPPPPESARPGRNICLPFLQRNVAGRALRGIHDIWLGVVISRSRPATLPEIWTEPRAGLSGLPHESGSEESRGWVDYQFNYHQ